MSDFFSFSQTIDNERIRSFFVGRDSNFYVGLDNFLKGGVEREMTVSFSADSLVRIAETYIGTPHCMGGTTHKCIDCSGLLYATFAYFGKRLPHNSQEIARYGKIILDQDSLRKGDLVFFSGTYSCNKFITHSGIYVGEGQFIHTSFSSGVVVSVLKSRYYQKHYVFATRLFK